MQKYIGIESSHCRVFDKQRTACNQIQIIYSKGSWAQWQTLDCCQIALE